MLSEGISNLASLAKLDMDGCSSLTSLLESLGNLASLTNLNLQGCESLTSLPESLGNLDNLTNLDLGRMPWSTIPDGIAQVLGNLASLTELDLSECSSLTSLPESLGNLASLVKLVLGGCKCLLVTEHPMIRKLAARGVKVVGVELVDDLGALPSLEMSVQPWTRIPPAVV